MSDQPSRALQLLDALAEQVNTSAEPDTRLSQWQMLAERRQRKLEWLENQLYRSAMTETVLRDALRHERDTAYRLLASLVAELQASLDERTTRSETLSILVQEALVLLAGTKFLDSPNLDSDESVEPF